MIKSENAKKHPYYVFLLTTILSFPVLAEEIIISVNSLIADSYSEWVQNTPCSEIKNYNHINANRGTVELLLICQALHVAGPATSIRLMVVPNYGRALMQASVGKAHIPAESIWYQDIDKAKFYISDPIIREGEYEKGVYTLRSNTAVLSVRTLDELRKYSAVLPVTWEIDRKALESAKIRTYFSSTKKNAFRMLLAKRADFILLEFSNSPRISLHEEANKHFVPIPNIRVNLPGERYFVVSKAAPGAKELFARLNTGIKMLREAGIIQRAYTESGFFNQKGKDFITLF